MDLLQMIREALGDYAAKTPDCPFGWKVAYHEDSVKPWTLNHDTAIYCFRTPEECLVKAEEIAAENWRIESENAWKDELRRNGEL